MTEYLALLFAALLVLFSVPVVIWLVWRLRRLERTVESLRRDERNVLDMHLHSLIEELELRGEHLRAQLEQSEGRLVQVLQHISLLATEPRATPQPEPRATPHPEPRATPHPEPRATPQPEPRATPQPEPPLPHHLAELAASGQAPEDIARDLRLGVGEVELALRLSHWNTPPDADQRHPR